jgi:hypothetical protein
MKVLVLVVLLGLAAAVGDNNAMKQASMLEDDLV